MGVFRDRARDFFTNWSESEEPLHRKVALTIKNRVISTGRGRQCCGHPGQPGC